MKYNTRPIPRKVRRIMPPEQEIPVLIEERWRFKQFGQMENGVRLFFYQELTR